MKFYDHVTIHVESGKGGDGSTSGRREAGAPFGGPSGGNGGKGGDIIIKASRNINTLLAYKYNKHIKAPNGEMGMSRDRYGKDGQDVVLEVPVGTIVKDAHTKKLIFQCLEDGQQCVLCRGGKGGTGNMHFANSTRQYPNFALQGEPAEIMDVELELQLLGDCALIGTPSVGKSTIINMVSNVKAKVADYPFTTLVPNLGTVVVNDYSFIIVDIPGLIAGAHQGKGLGNEFLRHILKAKIFCFVVDITRYDEGMNDIPQLIEEIVLYAQQKYPDATTCTIEHHDQTLIMKLTDNQGKTIWTKGVLFLINKVDECEDTEIIDEYTQQIVGVINECLTKKYQYQGTKNLIKQSLFVISGMFGQGVDARLNYTMIQLQKTIYTSYYDQQALDIQQQKQENTLEKGSKELYDSLIQDGYLDKQTLDTKTVWSISHPQFARLVFITQWGNEEAELRFRSVVQKEGRISRLEEGGVQQDDVLHVQSPYRGQPAKFILYKR